MPEVNTEMKTFVVKYICDSCTFGEFLPTGQVFSTMPSQYVHKCNHCGTTTVTEKQYPYIRYECADI